MINEDKTCLDCLHCKVSAKSNENCRWCFCDVSEKHKKHREIFWQRQKKMCEKFNDINADEYIRRPLLRKGA